MRHEVREVVAKAALPVFLLTGSLAVNACAEQEGSQFMDDYESPADPAGNDDEPTTTIEANPEQWVPELATESLDLEGKVEALWSNLETAVSDNTLSVDERLHVLRTYFFAPPEMLTPQGADKLADAEEQVRAVAEYQESFPDYRETYDVSLLSPNGPSPNGDQFVDVSVTTTTDETTASNVLIVTRPVETTYLDAQGQEQTETIRRVISYVVTD